MDKLNVKLERRSPSSSSASLKEASHFDGNVVDDERASDVPEIDDDEISDTETGDDGVESKPMSHQQAMEHFKDALAEIIVVCNSCILMLAKADVVVDLKIRSVNRARRCSKRNCRRRMVVVCEDSRKENYVFRCRMCK